MVKVRELTPREKALVDLLWEYLQKSKDHPDRRVTGMGTKTKVGLVNSIAWIMDKRRTS
jgi:hypothetical protein